MLKPTVRTCNAQKPFLQLGDGKLFLVEDPKRVARVLEVTAPYSSYRRKQPRRVERYWLW